MPAERNELVLHDDQIDAAVEAFQDPLYFIKKALGVHLWSKQEEIVRSVWENKYTAVKASFNVGKTFVAACITLAFLIPNKNSRVVTTAPTSKQVEDLLWGEIGNLVSNAPYELFDQKSDARLNQTDLVLDGKKWFATGVTVQVGKEEQSAVRISGYHAPRLLAVIDEATGVHNAIWKSLNGLMSGEHCKQLAITNPRTNLGEFKRFCEDPKVNVITISAFDHPNIKERREVIPGGISVEWVEEMIDKHCTEVKRHNGDDHTFEWNGKIYKPDDTAIWELLGEFPKSSTELFFGMLNEKIHHKAAEEIPEYSTVIPGFMDYGNWAVFYYAKLDNNRNIYILNEWVVNDRDMELKERAENFRNWCFYHGYRDFTVIGDVDMFAEPSKAYGGGRPVVETFRRICKGPKNEQTGEYDLDLGITFVRAMKQKKEDKHYRVYCNRKMKDRLNWRKDSNGLWLRKPSLYVDKNNCPYFYQTVPGLVTSPINPEDFDESIGIDHPIDAAKGLVATVPGAPIDTDAKKKGIEELRRQIREQFQRAI